MLFCFLTVTRIFIPDLPWMKNCYEPPWMQFGRIHIENLSGNEYDYADLSCQLIMLITCLVKLIRSLTKMTIWKGMRPGKEEKLFPAL